MFLDLGPILGPPAEATNAKNRKKASEKAWQKKSKKRPLDADPGAEFGGIVWPDLKLRLGAWQTLGMNFSLQIMLCKLCMKSYAESTQNYAMRIYACNLYRIDASLGPYA